MKRNGSLYPYGDRLFQQLLFQGFDMQWIPVKHEKANMNKYYHHFEDEETKTWRQGEVQPGFPTDQ